MRAGAERHCVRRRESRRVSQKGSYYSFATSFLDGKERFSLRADLRHILSAGRDEVKKLLLRLADDEPMIEAFHEDYLETMKARLEKKFEFAESRGERFDIAEEIANYTRAIVPVSIDSAGRFSIPDRMKKFTRISDAIVVEGAGEVMRIWAPEDYLEQPRLHRMIREEGEAFLAEVAGRRSNGGKA